MAREKSTPARRTACPSFVLLRKIRSGQPYHPWRPWDMDGSVVWAQHTNFLIQVWSAIHLIFVERPVSTNDHPVCLTFLGLKLGRPSVCHRIVREQWYKKDGADYFGLGLMQELFNYILSRCHFARVWWILQSLARSFSRHDVLSILNRVPLLYTTERGWSK